MGDQKTVFLDIDDTLITAGEGGPFPDDIAGIEKARLRGHRFFLCTGRSLAHIPPVFLELSWIDGMVASGGAHVILEGKTIYHTWLPLPPLCEIAALFLAKGKQCSFRGDRQVFTVNRNKKVPITAGEDFVQKYPDAHVSMMTADLTMGEEEKTLLKKYFDLYPQYPHYDCFIKGEGKAKGMQMILDALGLDRKDSVAIGDSENDLDMMDYAGTGIAVGNACSALKTKASWVSASVGEGAVVRALEHLGLC
jgi:Cof subfamily protein (haloacid dehalogenase superfamily)